MKTQKRNQSPVQTLVGALLMVIGIVFVGCYIAYSSFVTPAYRSLDKSYDEGREIDRQISDYREVKREMEQERRDDERRGRR